MLRQQQQLWWQEDLACTATVSNSSGTAQRLVERSGLQVQMQVLKKTAMLRCGMARHTQAMKHMLHRFLQDLKR
jgi:hypothetical protein